MGSLLTQGIGGRIRGAAQAASGVALLLFLSAAGPAKAAGPYEPNNSMGNATGSVIDSEVYEAEIENLADPDNQIPQDNDYYRIKLKRAGEVDVAYSNLQNGVGCFGPEARLLDAAGMTLGTAQPPRDETEHIRYDAPGPGTYYLYVRPYQIEPCEPPDLPYRFSVTGIGRSPEFTVERADLTREKLEVRGTLADAAPAGLVRVVAWDGGAKRSAGQRRVSFKLRGRPDGNGRWIAAGRLPDSLRGVNSLRYRPIYRGNSTYRKVSLKPKTAHR